MVEDSNERCEIQITNVNPALKKELKNIAAYEGKTLAGFLRSKILTIKNSYPEKARNYKEEESE